MEKIRIAPSDRVFVLTGAGISARTFLERGLLPTLRTLGTSRAELKAAMAHLTAAGAAAPSAFMSVK